jgi:integrase/recombinase XerD
MRETLADRILTESEVEQLLAAERHPRNRVILHLFYISGMRVSELAALRWSDLQERNEGRQVTVFGKGGKTRTVLLPLATWLMLVSTRGAAGDEQPVFPSRRGGHLHPSQLLRIVQKAAKRAGIEKPVSPHWFRHSHASHALDRGAPIHLVQTTLGHASVATTSHYLHSRPKESSSTYLKH